MRVKIDMGRLGVEGKKVWMREEEEEDEEEWWFDSVRLPGRAAGQILICVFYLMLEIKRKWEEGGRKNRIRSCGDAFLSSSGATQRERGLFYSRYTSATVEEALRHLLLWLFSFIMLLFRRRRRRRRAGVLGGTCTVRVMYDVMESSSRITSRNVVLCRFLSMCVRVLWMLS